MTEKPHLYIYVNNHFDPTWRRCWDRRFTWQGRTYASYADLEAYYMLDNLELAAADPGYKFEAESAIVLRKFLERYPERRDTLVELARAGRFGVTGAGETIVDSNMILGESLVRNFVVGLRWVEATLGQMPGIGVRNDAFGNSAQLPQILRGCELDWATGMSYSPAEGIYWRGLDGSTIVHATLPTAASGGGNTKYPPCPTCGGDGEVADALCGSCGGRGIDVVERAWLPGPVDDAALEAFNAGLVPMTPEELLPNPALMDWAEEQRDHYQVAFALEEEVRPYLQGWFTQLSDPPEDKLHPGVELNPNNAGCWVTRIKTKQTCRRQEYAVLATEVLNVCAALADETAPMDRAPFNAVWQQLFFTMFHDAITATHVDPAYAELQEVWRDIDTATERLQSEQLAALVIDEDDTISVINPTSSPATEICSVVLAQAPSPPALVDEAGTPVPMVEARELPAGPTELRFVAVGVPGFGARHYRVVADDALTAVTALPKPIIQNQRFRIEADDEGLVSIWDKRLKTHVAEAGPYRPAELVLEHDEGSPWATLHPDQGRTGLAPYTTLVRAEKGPGVQRLIFNVRTPRGLGFAGTALQAQVTLTLTEGIDRVDIHVDAHWDAFNQRLRLAMPMPCRGRHLYEIPYGILEREPYEPSFGWAGANGDWPAVNWAGVEAAASGDDPHAGLSVALLNQGLPSYRIEPVEDDGTVVFVSLLRSPAVPTYLHEPEFYTMTAWDGMRDAGDHSFDLALTAYDRPFAESSVVLDADHFNAGLLAVRGKVALPAMPTLGSDTARIAAVKGAEEGHGLILRLHEFRGRGGEVSLHLPFSVASVAKVNMLERKAEPLSVEDGTVHLTLRPWEIATVRVELSAQELSQ